MIEFIKPTEELIKVIAENMRDADAAEVWASHRHTPLQALMSGWESSHKAAIVSVNGRPCVMLGLVVRDVLTGTGVPWLLGTDYALKHAREFLKLSPPVIEEMLHMCPRLFNYVHADNIVSIRWLKWLGFKVDAPLPHGPKGELFHRFHMERDYV